jgi:hypothetical protein
MTYSKANIEKLFPLASLKEIRQVIPQRSRSVINQRLLRSDIQEYTYKAPRKLTGLEFYNVNRKFYKLLGKY